MFLQGVCIEYNGEAKCDCPAPYAGPQCGDASEVADFMLNEINNNLGIGSFYLQSGKLQICGHSRNPKSAVISLTINVTLHRPRLEALMRFVPDGAVSARDGPRHWSFHLPEYGIIQTLQGAYFSKRLREFLLRLGVTQPLGEKYALQSELYWMY